MITAPMSFVFATFLTATTFSPAVGQENLSAKELVDSLGDFLKKKNDEFAIGVLEMLSDKFSEFEKGDQKNAVKAAEKCLGQRRDEGDNKLYNAALNSLVGMGEQGEKAAIKALKHKNVKGRPEVLGTAINAVVAHKNDKSLKTVISYLVYKEPAVVASTAEALGKHFVEKEEKVRKQIVEQLVKNYATYYSRAQANRNDPRFQDQLNAVESSMQFALRELTGQDLEEAPAWQTWYNDNKKKKWESPSQG